LDSSLSLNPEAQFGAHDSPQRFDSLGVNGGDRAVETTSNFAWQRNYQTAILETDPSRLPELIAAAQTAIEARVAEIKSARFCTPAEQQALDDARSGLRLLSNEVSLSQQAS
jgi:hypothetical protein